MITISILTDRFKINCGLARQIIRELDSKGLVKPLVVHSSQMVYTGSKVEEKAAAVAASVDGSAEKKVERKTKTSKKTAAVKQETKVESKVE